ncbi:disulfide bond formation protein B [Methylopila musalis]|uniref:Disulfide bond formation protein B n=1 Tax=Methylopila musalis TaxID=1134781 RepID=A0ABW3ZAX2_9HYPH
MTLSSPSAPSSARSRLAGAALAVAVIGAAAIGGALVFEHVFGYVPCMLCLWQRWPYYLGVPLALAAAALARGGTTGAARAALILVALLFAVGAGLGVHHAGVEWGFWPGPASCAGANAAPSSVGGLMESMRGTRIVPCDSAAWRFLGLSLAGYNALIAAGLSAIAVWGLRRG